MPDEIDVRADTRSYQKLTREKLLTMSKHDLAAVAAQRGYDRDDRGFITVDALLKAQEADEAFADAPESGKAASQDQLEAAGRAYYDAKGDPADHPISFEAVPAARRPDERPGQPTSSDSIHGSIGGLKSEGETPRTEGEPTAGEPLGEQQSLGEHYGVQEGDVTLGAMPVSEAESGYAVAYGDEKPRRSRSKKASEES